MGNSQSTPRPVLRAQRIEGLTGCSSGKWVETTLTTPGEGYGDHVFPTGDEWGVYMASFADYAQLLTYIFLMPAIIENFFDGHAVAAWMAWAVAPVSRAFGSVAFGVVGDKYGRRTQLVSATSLICISSFPLVVLPRGWTIALIILRILTGLGLGGDLAGRGVYLMEISDERVMGQHSGFMMGAGHVATLFVAGASGAIRAMYTGDEWLEHGWRAAAFVLSLPSLLSLWLRIISEETEAFKRSEEAKSGGTEGGPKVTDYTRQIAIGAVVGGCCASGFTSLMFLYMQIIRSHPETNVMGLTSIVGVASIPIDYALGYLCDCIGAGSSLYMSQVAGVVLSLPVSYIYWTTHPGRHPLSSCTTGLVLTVLWEGWNRVALSPFVCELFPVEVRAKCFGLSAAPMILLCTPLPAILESLKAYKWLPGTFVTLFSLTNLVVLNYAFREREEGRLELTHIRHQPYNKLQIGVSKKAGAAEEAGALPTDQ